jgi:hypothetical protein
MLAQENLNLLSTLRTQLTTPLSGSLLSPATTLQIQAPLSLLRTMDTQVSSLSKVRLLYTPIINSEGIVEHDHLVDLNEWWWSPRNLHRCPVPLALGK